MHAMTFKMILEEEQMRKLKTMEDTANTTIILLRTHVVAGH